MDFLRDPIWQFIGVIIAIAALVLPYIQLRRKRNKKGNSDSTKDELLSVSNSQPGEIVGSRHYGKHKARKSDGILIANISSDFLNEFPVSIEILAKHLDMVYTPENFGASNWLDVFRRFTKEEYFSTTKKMSLKKMSYATLLNPGSKLFPHLEGTKRMRRRIMGLDNEVNNDD